MFAWVSTSRLPTLNNIFFCTQCWKTFDEAKDIDIQNTFGNLEKKKTYALEYSLILRCSQQGEEVYVFDIHFDFQSLRG